MEQAPRPFVWTMTADEILDTLATYCRRSNYASGSVSRWYASTMCWAPDGNVRPDREGWDLGYDGRCTVY
jgi:hypothetical protein